MIISKKLWPIVIIAFASATTAFTALSCKAESAKEPMRAMVIEVEDSRKTQSKGECTVRLQLMGDAVYGARQVVTARISKAEDQMGRNLLPSDQDVFQEYPSNNSIEQVFDIHIRLRNPARNARSIRLIQGEADLFFPDKSDKSKISISNFYTVQGGILQDPALEAAQAKIAYVPQALSQDEKKKMIREVHAGTWNQSNDEQMLDFMVQQLSATPSFGRTGPTLEKLDFLVSDPKDRIREIAFFDDQGKPLESRGRSNSVQYRTYFFEKIPANVQAVIYIAVPDTIQTVPFEAKDIPLP